MYILYTSQCSSLNSLIKFVEYVQLFEACQRPLWRVPPPPPPPQWWISLIFNTEFCHNKANPLCFYSAIFRSQGRLKNHRWIFYIKIFSSQRMPHQIFFLSTRFRTHCKDKIPKFRIGVSVPISTFMRLWVIYIFPRSVCLICWRKYVDRSWDYINRVWGRAIPRKGIHKWDFRCSAFRGHKPFCRFLWFYCTANMPLKGTSIVNGPVFTVL